MEYSFLGLTIGICTFLIIGMFHPLTIKCEYYFGTRCWWWFLLLGIIGVGASLLVHHIFWSSLLGVLAFSSFWTIGEIFQQRQRVERGWFPAGPGHLKEAASPKSEGQELTTNLTNKTNLEIVNKSRLRFANR